MIRQDFSFRRFLRFETQRLQTINNNKKSVRTKKRDIQIEIRREIMLVPGFDFFSLRIWHLYVFIYRFSCQFSTLFSFFSSSSSFLFFGIEVRERERERKLKLKKKIRPSNLPQRSPFQTRKHAKWFLDFINPVK